MIKEKGLKVLASLFLAVFILSFSSAALTLTNVPTLSQTDDFFVFTLESDVNETVTVSVAPIVDGTQTIVFDDTTVDLINGTQQVVRVNYSASNFDFEFGEEYSTNMTVSGSETVVRVISFESNNYCGAVSNEGNLRVTIEDVKVIEGFGDEDDYWYLFDEIELEIVVENNGNYDLEDVELEWVLYAGEKKIMNDDVSGKDIDEGDEETFFITIKLDEDIDDFENEEAFFYVKAIGEIDSSGSNDGDLTCNYEDKSVEVRSDERFVILNEFSLNNIDLDEMVYDSSVFSCGDRIIIRADAWNIGDRDEDDVYVQFYNSNLGLNEIVELGDLDAFDSESVFFEFEIPEDIGEGWQNILIEVYDDDNDLYENSEDDESSYTLSIKTESCYIEPPVINAVLESEAVAGDKMVVLATITNTNNKRITGSLILDGYSDWASLDSIDTNVVNLDAQEVKQVRMEFSVDRKAEGTQSFNLNILSEGEIISSQPISVTLEESKFNLFDFFLDNKNTILIVLLNLILLILIIVIAVKILRRR